ncbi:tape measure protein [Acrasis kona]|uniref:Tape measure protein n=1 Tax=Acrasis kona TaxID=1008807 RepID=A0AAW2ZTA2_9EUKA
MTEQKVTTKVEDKHDHDTAKGAVGGAVVGSVVPGVGTLAGAAIGGVVGHYTGEAHKGETKTTTETHNV